MDFNIGRPIKIKKFLHKKNKSSNQEVVIKNHSSKSAKILSGMKTSQYTKNRKNKIEINQIIKKTSN